MLTLELSSIVLEIPDDAYTTLSQEDCTVHTTRFLSLDRNWKKRSMFRIEQILDYTEIIGCMLLSSQMMNSEWWIEVTKESSEYDISMILK